MKFVRLFFALAFLWPVASHAQLAITEVMSSASTNKGPSQVSQNSDFWELTNFGKTAIDLTGYRFYDSGNNLAAADPTIFAGLTLAPGESALFVQSNFTTNETLVREWWGLAPTVQIRMYPNPGLSSTGDGIRVWGPDATDPADVIDSVDFAEAVRGSTFTYDAATGVFGIYSTNGVGGAHLAATADDIGSPGTTIGPVPLRITQQPTNVVVNPGDTAKLTVASQGLPRARVQWFFGNTAIDGATKAKLTITDVQAANSGQYHAVLNNGVMTSNTATVEIVLQSQSSPPAFTATPGNFTLTIGQGHLFHSHATGVPQPAYQWQFKGVDIDGATAEDFVFIAGSADQTGEYSVIARNARGAATNKFTITVTPPPHLVITEGMSSENPNTPAHADFWELSNLGDFPVSLKGYRFDDNSETLAAAFTFTNDVVIAPGESIIFTEVITADTFKTWWGADKLPAGLKIITYTGNGLSSAGDAVNVWNAAASDNFDKVASVTFSTGTAGASFRYNPDTQQFGELSTAGAFGAFAAAVGGDIGSPGYVTAPPVKPEITEIKRVTDGVSITWKTAAGKQYLLQARSNIDSGEWTTVRTVTATADSATEVVAIEAGSERQFYRISAP